jgi:long-chain acyl-CoA synthetase
MPQESSRRWTERFRRPVYEGYGLTECSPFAAYNHDFRHKLGTVGTAVENVELKILDEQDREVPHGAWGEICIQGPGVMKGYWGKPEETARAIRGGWLHSGDIGTMDDEGYVSIVDRVKDMINVSGFKVWPAEVEQALYRHPAVREVAVYGVSDPPRARRWAAISARGHDGHRRGDHRVLSRPHGGVQGAGQRRVRHGVPEERDRQDPQANLASRPMSIAGVEAH